MRMFIFTLAIVLGGCASTSPQESEHANQLSQLTETFRAEALAQRANAIKRKRRVDNQPRFDCVEHEEGIDLRHLPPVDVSFIEADIREALLEISMLTEVPIVADETVQGLVTATVLGKDIESALRVVLAPGNFTYKRFPEFIYVGSQFRGSPSLAILSETCRYRPRNIEAAKISGLLSEVEREFIKVNEENNLISIVAPPTFQDKIQRSLLLLDQPREQVLLEVSIIEVSREIFDILGIHWGNLNLVEQGLELAVINELLDRGGSGQNNYNYGGSNLSPVALKRFKDSIGVMKTNGDVAIKAMPSIVTLDGKEANFNSTETLWVPGLADASSGRSKGLAYGVNIKVVPHIGSHHDIRLDIQDASVSDLTLAAGGEPILVSHSVSNFVEVSDGDVVVLGGLLQHKQRTSEASVPGLSKAPVFKRLFSQERRETKETEVLIVIKPTILG